MEKIRRKHLNAVCGCCLLAGTVFAQKSGLESYNQLDRQHEYRWMSVLHYQSKKGYYAECRYNYEELNTASLFLGKTIERKGSVTDFSITPLVGFSAGTFNGVSIGLNAGITSGNLFFSSQMQYSHSFKDPTQRFYFNWSEAGFSWGHHWYGGLSLQYTASGGTHLPEPGLFAGLQFRNFSIPFYLFRPFSTKRFVILGLNYEYTIPSRKRNNRMHLQPPKG